MLNNLTIKNRLFLIIGIMSVLAISLSVMGLYGMKQANDGLQTVYLDRVVPLKDLKIIADMYAVNIVDTTHKVRNGNVSWQEAIKNVDDAEKIIQEKWDGYLATVLVEQEEKLVAEIKPLFASIQPKINNLQAILNRNDHVAVTDFSINELYPAIDPISGKFSELIEVQLVVAKQEYEDAKSRYKVILIMSITALVSGLLMTIGLGLLIIRQIISSITIAQKMMEAIANGDLSLEIETNSNDELGVMLNSLSKMRGVLNNAIISVNITMGEISQGDLNSRITGKFNGDFNKIKTGMNSSLDTISETLNDVIHVANALAAGDLNQKITKSYSGVFEQTKNSVNYTVEELQKIVQEIEAIVYSGADCGDFSVKMTTHDKVGYGKRLAELINQLFETTEKSLGDVLRVAEALAEGDLTQHIHDDYVGAFASVKVGMNTTVDNLKLLMGEIKNTSEVIAAASNEIAAGNNDLSHRTEEQASSLQQTAASMEELSVAVQQNTENAKRANQLAEGASITAKKGVSVVHEVVKTMATIKESSHKIVDIITVIDDIAFQTNILALNAAVEAARAGDSGKGFAVVAVEVRNLAQRAANAAGEIKRLINDSVENISGGSTQVEQAGKTMEDIVCAIENVTHIMSEIAAASIQQNSGIDQVHQAVTQMDYVTQQNAALVEQSAAAAESLSEQTQHLAKEMTHFKISR
ncbi:MAG: chemotaxis protein [Pseudomonadota bacterium]